jgi:hypothetical protein
MEVRKENLHLVVFLVCNRPPLFVLYEGKGQEANEREGGEGEGRGGQGPGTTDNGPGNRGNGKR